MKKNVLTLSAAIKIMVVLAVLAVLTTVLNVIVNIKKTTLQTDLRKARLLLEKTVNEEPQYTEEDKEYFTLLEALSDKTRQIKETDNEKIKVFLETYNERISYDVWPIDGYEEKQVFIKKRFSDIFTEEAFKKTKEYEIATQPEKIVIKDDKSKKERILYNRIVNQNKEVVQKYVSVKEDGIETILKINNGTTRWEYQKLTLKENSESYIITDFEYLDVSY